MAKATILKVKKATYLDGFKLLIGFSDGKEKVVDFGDFINTNNKEILERYKNPSNFKKFKIEEGNLVWGKNWDLIFPINQLYRGKISL